MITLYSNHKKKLVFFINNEANTWKSSIFIFFAAVSLIPETFLGTVYAAFTSYHQAFYLYLEAPQEKKKLLVMLRQFYRLAENAETESLDMQDIPSMSEPT